MLYLFWVRLVLVLALLLGFSSSVFAFDSFPPETLVHVRFPGADVLEAHQGRTLLKPIGDIRLGDEVLAFGEWKEKGNTPNADERLSYEKVTDIFSSHREQTLVHLTLQTGEQLTATAGHPFKTPEGWRDAILLKKGGKLLLKGSDGDEKTITIADVNTETKVQVVLNLEVANAHTFFVGEEGVLVHNSRVSPPAPGRPTPENTGGLFKPGKGSGHYKKHPSAGGKMGWIDCKGNVWSPTGGKDHPLSHGGSHWDVQCSSGGYCNVYPGGRTRGGGRI